jgi:RNA polymerase sigma factor (sigma-70 family)
MTTAQLGLALRHVRRLLNGHRSEELSDGQLLEQFAVARDTVAFEVLLRRHGPLVLSVCRRVLVREHDAEDAFQATFLVLARKAASVRKRESVGSWLYGVAYRVAVEAKTSAVRRRGREALLTDVCRAGAFASDESRERTGFMQEDPMQIDPAVEASRREVRALLDEELGRLPDKYRAPLVLCYLQGKTNAEAAEELGWAAGTFKTRLLRGREMLRAKLTGRGVAVASSALMAVLAASAARAAVPMTLLHTTKRAAVCFAAGKTAGGLLSVKAISLAQTMLKSLTFTKLKLALVVSVTLSLLSAGATALVYTPAAAQVPGRAGENQGPSATAPAASNERPRTDLFDDPLPSGALARMGTVRWRHGQVVFFTSFLPDGKTLVTAGHDGTIRLWDVATGKELRRLVSTGESAPGASAAPVVVGGGGAGGAFLGVLGNNNLHVALAADGKTLASTGRDGRTIHLWDPATGKELRRFKRPEPAVAGLALSADAKLLAAKGADGTIHVLEAATGKEIRRLGKRQGDGVMFLVSGGESQMFFSPDARSLAALVVDFQNQQAKNVLKLWDVTTGEERLRIDQPEQHWLHSIAFSPDGKILAWHANDGLIRLVNPTTGKIRRTIEAGAVSRFTFSPDGKMLLTEGNTHRLDGDRLSRLHQIVQLWDVASGREVRRFAGKAQTPGQMIRPFDPGSAGLALSPDGTILALGGEQHRVRLLDTKTGKELHPLVGHDTGLSSVQFSPDGQTLITRGDDGTLRAWETLGGKQRRQIPVPDGAMSVVLSRDGRTFAAGEPTNTIRVRDAHSGKELLKIEDQKNGFSAFALAPDGRMLAVRGMNDPTIRLIDVASGKELRRLGASAKKDDAPGGAIQFTFSGASWLVFSPDGRTLASLQKSNVLALWDVASGQELTPIRLPDTSFIRAAAFSPDGRALAVDTLDGSVTVREVATGRVRRTLVAPPENVAGKGGAGVALAAVGAVMAQPVNAAGPIVAFSIFTSAPNHIAFSTDGRTVACARANRTVALWDVASGRELGAFSGHQGELSALAFARDGKALASGSADTTALVWDLSRLRHQEPGIANLTSEKLAGYWADLAREDAARAFAAQCAFRSASTQAVSFFGKHLHATGSADAARVEQLITELDSKRFQTRQRASVELEKIGEPVVPSLRRALSGQPSAETRQRAEALLRKLTGRANISGERLRSLRATEILEQIGTAEARRLLESLATGIAESLQTSAAREALTRLEH